MDKLTDYLNLIRKNRQRGGALTANEKLMLDELIKIQSAVKADSSKKLTGLGNIITPFKKSNISVPEIQDIKLGPNEAAAMTNLDNIINDLKAKAGSSTTSTSTSGAPSAAAAASAAASSLTPPGGAPSLSSTGGPSPPSSSSTPPPLTSGPPPPPSASASSLAPPPPVVASSLAPPPLAPPSSSSALTPPPSTGGPSPPPIVAPSTAVASSISKVLRPSLIDYGDPEFSSYNVRVYKSTGNRGDTLLGSTVASSGQTIKSVLDSIKGAGVSQRCIVTSHHNFVNSIGPKDYYVSFNNLRLRNGNVELFLI